MQDEQKRTFFLSIETKNGLISSHRVTDEPPSQEAEGEMQDPSPSPEKTPQPSDVLTFASVFTALALKLRTYRDFIPFNLFLAPLMSQALAGSRIQKFAENKGKKRGDLNAPGIEVFELNVETFPEFQRIEDEIQSTLGGAEHLPEVMIIGLISAYDAFLSNLLRVIFRQNPKIVLTDDKAIKFSELIEFGSIEAARSALIDREVENIIRLSHHAQFERLEAIYKIPLRKNLPVWAAFIEVCERRNLITHTGGTVSNQYLRNCKAEGCDTGDLKAGDRIRVPSKYFSKAVRAVAEVSLKLAWVSWRKFAPEEVAQADNNLNELGFNLIHDRNYVLAEALLSFGSDVLKRMGGSDQIRKMMIVNLANALHMQDKKEQAIKILDAEDWSATNDEFGISVAAVRGDIPTVIALMEKFGANSKFNKEHYRTWPVFRKVSDDPVFVSTFERIFSEPFIKVVSKPATQVDGNQAPSSSEKSKVKLELVADNTDSEHPAAPAEQ